MIGEPNLVAFVMLVVWPFVALLVASRVGLLKGTLFSLLVGQLLLPVGAGIKIPMIPALEKYSSSSIIGIFYILRSSNSGLFRVLPKYVLVLILCLFVSPLFTSVGNSDVIINGGKDIDGVGLYDAISATIGQGVMLIPFIFGAVAIGQLSKLDMIIKFTSTAGLIYLFPIIVEVRLSPQIHNWVYGYIPHEFIQQVRDGGYRPIVFLGHGLAVGQFMSFAAVCSIVLLKTQVTHKAHNRIRLLLVWVGVVLCKSFGPFIYTFFASVILFFLGRRARGRVLIVLSVLIFTYPLARLQGWFPTDELVEIFKGVDPDRGDSLKYRFDQEERLLDRAKERIWFGWGRYGRSRIFDEYGRDISVTDSDWIITIGNFGLFGYLVKYSLILSSIIALVRMRTRSLDGNDVTSSDAASTIIFIQLLDLTINSAMLPWTWLLVGSAWGMRRLKYTEEFTHNSSMLSFKSEAKAIPLFKRGQAV